MMGPSRNESSNGLSIGLGLFVEPLMGEGLFGSNSRVRIVREQTRQEVVRFRRS